MAQYVAEAKIGYYPINTDISGIRSYWQIFALDLLELHIAKMGTRVVI
jgi:hypothetical protein